MSSLQIRDAIKGSIAIGKGEQGPVGPVGPQGPIGDNNVCIGLSPTSEAEIWFDTNDAINGEEIATKKFVETTNEELSSRLDNLIISNGDGNKDSELIDARNGETTLGNKIRKIDESLDNIKSVIEVNPHEVYKLFNIDINGEIDCYKELNEFISFCKNNKINTIFLPVNSKLLINKMITIPNGINIDGRNSTIIRNFDKVNFGTMRLLGDNIIENLVIDGNNINIDHKNDFTQYADYWVYGDNITIKNCKGINSCGSNVVIQNSNNIRIENNRFYGFLDHAIYTSKPSDNNVGISKNLIINGNKIDDSVSIREAIKIRNGIEDVIIQNNFINIPNGVSITIDAGDDVEPMNTKNIIIDKNITLNKTFVNTYSSRGVYVEELIVINNITNCLTNFIGYTYPSNTKQNGTSIKNLIIKNNDIKKGNSNTEPLFTFNGDIENLGIVNVIIENNNISYSAHSRLFYIFGKVINIKFKNNNIECLTTTTTNEKSHPIFNFVRTGTPAELYKHNNKMLVIDGNNFTKSSEGVLSPLIMDTGDNSIDSLITWDILVINNIFDNNGILRLISSGAKNITTIDKKLVVKNNINVNNSITTGNWNTTNITSDLT